MKKLYITVGIPGSGKSTWVEKNVSDAVIINMDSIRQALTGDASDQSRNNDVFAQATKTLREAIQNGGDIVWDNTTISKKYRKDMIQAARSVGYDVIGVFFNVSLAEAKRRNLLRHRIVPAHVLEKMHANLQEPTLDEGFTEIIRV